MDAAGYRVDAVVDGEGRVEPTELFPGTAAADWERHRDLLDREGLLPHAVGGYLLRGHGRTVLVDLGYGPGSLGRIRCGRLLESLAALGVAPADVTDVLLTHLHRDHVGWASVGGEPQLPTATLHCHRDDYEHFVTAGRGDPSIAERLEPCRDQLRPLDDSAPLPALTVVHAPGHTPGSVVVVLRDGPQPLALLGDVVHSPVQLVERSWNTPYDVDAGLAVVTRAHLLSALSGPPASLVAGAHFPGLRFHLLGGP